MNVDKAIPADLYNLIGALSIALDFTSRDITEHHKRVAFLSLETGRAMGLDPGQLLDLYCASSLHDIGAVTFWEKALLAEFEVENPSGHCERGFHFLKDSDIFSPIAGAVLCHHDRWDGGGKSVRSGPAIPLLSRIIHLADRVDILIDADRHILQQQKGMVNRLKSLAGTVFDPEIVEAFSGVAERESFWLDLVSPYLDDRIGELAGPEAGPFLTAGSLLQVARLFARVIDSKSKFTHRHSTYVSAVAVKLCSLMGFGREEQERMAVAGLLHDLGKLSIPEEILEKPGRLTGEEFSVIKQHTYHTYHILNRIAGFGEIKEWAAFHHEKLDGTGYPFRVGGERLSTGARIMAVSDIFCALTEDRPYRPGLDRPKVEEIMADAVKNRAIDSDITGLLCEHYADLAELKNHGGHFPADSE